VDLYIQKQDKKIKDMAHLHMLLLYGGQATLAIVMVEQLNQGLSVEEAVRLSSIMTTISQPKATTISPSKGRGTSKPLKKVVVGAEVE
jgi:hypothetical protein